jgi:hypothetical protein
MVINVLYNYRLETVSFAYLSLHDKNKYHF